MKACIKYFSVNFLLIVLFISEDSFAQKAVFGLKTGLAFSNATIDQTNIYGPQNRLTRTGALFGVYLDVPCGKALIFRPGAELVSKGFRRKLDPYGVEPIRFTYADFPISILYRKKGNKGHLIAGGGPVLDIPLQDYYSTYSLKPEFGVNGMIGYELAIGFSLNLNYNYGLSNASKDKQYVSKISNHYLGVSVGYTF